MIKTLLLLECPVTPESMIRFQKCTEMSMMPQVGSEYLETSLPSKYNWYLVVVDVIWGTNPEWMKIRLGMGEELVDFASHFNFCYVANHLEEVGWTCMDKNLVASFGGAE